MKTLLAAAAIAFALGVSARATVIDDQRRLDVLTEACRGSGETGSLEEANKACIDEMKFEDDLKAHGYCVYGHGVIGRARGSHCYEIKEISSGKYLEKPWTEKRCRQTKTDCDLMPDGSMRPRAPEGPEGD